MSPKGQDAVSIDTNGGRAVVDESPSPVQVEREDVVVMWVLVGGVYM